MISRSADRNKLSHKLTPLGDQLETNGGAHNKRSTYSSRRKMAKIMKRTSPRKQRHTRVHSPGESDSSDQEQEQGDEEADQAQADDSEDDVGEPEAFAPSGAAVKLLKKSLPSKSTRQAGPHGSKRQKKLPSVKTRSSARIQRQSPTSADAHATSPNAAAILEDDSTVSSDDDDVYDLLDMMSEDDEDDLEVEAVEEEMLLREMEANGELMELGFAEGDSMFPDEDGTSIFAMSAYSGNYSDRYGIAEDASVPIIDSTRASVVGNATPKMPQVASLDTNLDLSFDPNTIAPSVPQSALTSPQFEHSSFDGLPYLASPEQVERQKTGLCTPSSLKQPLDWTQCMRRLLSILMLT
jgi:hypothetical protein